MKKYILVLVAFVLVVSIAGIARQNPAWASLLPAALRPISAAQPALGDDQSPVLAPPAFITTITGNGIYNIGGVCSLDVEFKVSDLQIIADAEVQHLDIKDIPFPGDPGESLLYPGCHIVHYKQGEIVNALTTEDGSAKICFGASPILTQRIFYVLDDPGSGTRTWIPMPTWLEDNERLLCGFAPYTGMYMPTGRLVPYPGSEQAGTNLLIPGGFGGSVLPPPDEVTFTSSGTYAVGGICLITAKYKITGLADTVRVEFPSEEYSEDTLTVPSEPVEGLFYFPGCHVIHFRDEKIKDEMTRVEGDWQICFAAIPGKIMTIYYYRDNETAITAPWIAIETTTERGLACADLVDFSAVYVPAGK
jgi:hypothetical protein